MVWYPDTEDQEDHENAAKFDVIVDGYWYTTPDDIVATRELNPGVMKMSACPGLPSHVTDTRIASHHGNAHPLSHGANVLVSSGTQR